METETFTKQYPLAIEALGQHMRAHGLPAPYEIHQDGREITVRISGGVHLLDAWTASVAIDEERSEAVDFGDVAGIRSAFLVRLPESGFRFTLIGYRPAPVWQRSVVPA